MTDTSRLRVLAIVPSRYDTSPGQRFRIEQWQSVLAAQGIDIDYAPFEDADLNAVLYKPGHLGRKLALVTGRLVARLTEALGARRYDLVYIFRESALVGPALVERLLAFKGVPFVFDFDDAVYVRYVSPSNGYLSYLKCPGKTRTDCRLAAHVIAGNQLLADYAAAFTPHVSIVPTTIDTAKYAPPIAERGTGVPVIGWSGSYSTAQYLDVVAGALKRLARRQPFKLLVIGAPGFTMEGVDVEAVQWEASTEVETLRRMDIGIMPLRDDPWARGKCALKALQYMALGIPAVCSPVGVNTDVIQHDKNGLLASGEDEWTIHLGRLLRDVSERRRLGLAGMETVCAEYGRDQHAAVVAGIFRRAAATKAD
jgi:glycosyltransferase involved in cell wall biosynthesis